MLCRLSANFVLLSSQKLVHTWFAYFSDRISTKTFSRLGSVREGYRKIFERFKLPCPASFEEACIEYIGDVVGEGQFSFYLTSPKLVSHLFVSLIHIKLLF